MKNYAISKLISLILLTSASWILSFNLSRVQNNYDGDTNFFKFFEHTNPIIAKVSETNLTKEANVKTDVLISNEETKTSKKTVESSSIPEYGDLINWNKASTLIPKGTTVKVIDLATKKTFNIQRTFGTNHLDGEPTSASDTSVIKSIWGGFSWERRPIIVNINELYIAASMTAMPHAGVDSKEAIKTVDNRSDGYGTGENLDMIKNNGMDGVIDIHFKDSTRHKDNKPDPQHQAAILLSSGK